MNTGPVAAIPSVGLAALDTLAGSQNLALPPAGATSFSKLLTDGAQKVSDDAFNADRLVHAFALSDAVPVHQVTYALEQARLSMSLMMQVRNHLVEAYQQMMNMQV
jgi:flagellar hook-basal body complex protein FliE